MHAIPRKILIFSLLLISFALFILGMIGPLNPMQETPPNWLHIIGMIILPMGCCVIAAWMSRLSIERIASLGCLAFILLFDGWMLLLQIFE